MCVIHACDKFLVAELAEIVHALELQIEPFLCTHVKIMHAFCYVCSKSLPRSIACVLMLHIKQILISILSHETSLILQAQGVRRAWVGDYDTLSQFISIAKYKQAMV